MTDTSHNLGRLAATYHLDILADGELVDATRLARALGFVYPVMISRSVWVDCITWDNVDRAHAGVDRPQTETCRLFDILVAADVAIRRRTGAAFTVASAPRAGADRLDIVTLVLVVSPSDGRTLTIMKADET